MAKETDRNIYRNGRYYHGRVKKDGWWQGRSLGTDCIKTARIKYAKLVARSLQEKPLTDKPEKPFESLLSILQDHIKHVERLNGPKTAERYRNALVHIQRHLGNPRVNTLTTDDFKEYILARLDKRAAAPSVQKEITFLGAAFSRAGNRVPQDLLKGCKVPGGDKARGRLLTKTEIQRLRDELAKSTILDHFLVALYTAIRKEELRGIEMKDVDFQAGTIYFPKTKNSDPKTVSMHRVVKEIMFRRRSDDPRHKPFHSPVNLIRPFQRAARRARVHDVTWHDLRRAAASHMFMAGADLPSVMAHGGWKTASVVLKIYAQTVPKHVEQQVAKMDFEGEQGAEAGARNETGTYLDDIIALEPREIENTDR